MFNGDEEVDPCEVKKFDWWIETVEIYREDGDYSNLNYWNSDKNLILFTDFIGGDFQNWVKIPYDQFKDIDFEAEENLTVLCYGIIDHGGHDVYRLELWKMSEEDNSIYFKIREKM